jgi:hypothetical protein
VFLGRKASPSAIVGWAQIAVCSALYGMRPTIAVWTAAIGMVKHHRPSTANAVDILPADPGRRRPGAGYRGAGTAR